jgi:hypothetical protein
MIVIQAFFSIEQIAEMNDLHFISTREPTCMGSFDLAVDPISPQDHDAQTLHIDT